MSPSPEDRSGPEQVGERVDPSDPLADDPARRRRRRRTLRDILIVAGVLLILGITFSILQNTVRVLDDDDFSADGITSVDLEVDDGDVNVSARETADDGSMSVEAQARYFLRKPDIDFEDDGSVGRLRTACEWPSNCDIDVRTSVPRGTDATLRTGAGDLSVLGPAGVVDARASDGSITVDGAERDVRVAISDGDITVQNITGAVRAEVTTGDLALEEVSGALRIRTGEGEVSATGLRSSDAEFESGTGNVDIDFDSTPERVEVDIGAGNLTLAVPSGTYRLDTDLGAGDLSVEGVEQDPEAARRITIRSGEGNVTVRGR